MSQKVSDLESEEVLSPIKLPPNSQRSTDLLKKAEQMDFKLYV